MYRFFFICLLSSFSFLSFSQFHPSTNVLLGTLEDETVELGFSYQFNALQAQLSYPFGNHFFGFMSYYSNNSTTETTSLVFGDVETRANQNNGLNLGMGYRKTTSGKKYNKLELLVGYDRQHNDVQLQSRNISFSANRRDKTVFNQAFAQVALINPGNKWDHAISLKMSYVNLTNWSRDSIEVDEWEGSPNAIGFCPAYHVDYRPFEHIVLKGQIGIYGVTPNFEFKNVENQGGLISEETYTLNIGTIYLSLGLALRL